MDKVQNAMESMLDELDANMCVGDEALHHIMSSTAPPQNTDAWIQWRMHRLTASDAPKIIGNAVKGRERLLREKWGLEQPWQGNEFTRAGHDHENDAVRAYERAKNVKVITDLSPICHPDYPQLAASLDGVTTGGVNIEIKCLQDRMQQHKKPKPIHLYQVFFQMACSKTQKTHLVYYYLNRPGVMDIFEIDFDQKWWDTNLPKFLEFSSQLPPERPAIVLSEL